jgi:transposase
MITRISATARAISLCSPNPLRDWRHIKVTRRRTKEDFAYGMRYLVDELYPDAKCIRVVLDNLNTHNPAALYEIFEPAEAKRILDKLEFHYTPKHSSGLNMAEIEFSVLTRQCLDRRIPDAETLRQEIAAWEAERNAQATVNLTKLIPLAPYKSYTP